MRNGKKKDRTSKKWGKEIEERGDGVYRLTVLSVYYWRKNIFKLFFLEKLRKVLKLFSKWDANGFCSYNNDKDILNFFFIIIKGINQSNLFKVEEFFEKKN